MRQRLQARLEGVLEAVARGRRESAMMLRVPGMDWAGIGGFPVGAQMMGLSSSDNNVYIFLIFTMYLLCLYMIELCFQCGVFFT